MLTLVPVTLLTTSCDKFLDIQPKGTMPKEVLFRDEQGFKDALTHPPWRRRCRRVHP